MVFLMPFLVALLWAIGFVRYQFGFLVLTALVPLLYFLKISQKKKFSPEKVISTVWFAGFLSFLSIMAWILSTRPGSWAGIDQKVPLIFVVLVWVLAALVMSVGPLIFILLITRFKKVPLDSWKIIVIIPGAWIIGEYIRSWLFSLFWYGAGATIGPHWNFGNLGLGLATTPLAPISRIIGLYGLSFIAVVINVALFWILNKRYKYACGILVATAMLLIISIFTFRASTRKINLGAVQLPVGQQDNQSLGTLIKSKHPAPVQLLVFPEYANFLSPQYPDAARPVLDAAFQGANGLGIETQGINDNNFDQEKAHLDRSYYFDKSGREITYQDKNFLIPNGEFLTGITRWLLDNTGHDGLVATFNRSRALQKADHPEHVVTAQGLRVGSLACSGIVSPELFRRLANQNADVLVNNASLNIFRSNEYFEQTKALARFDAVANNRPFIQATRDGYSYIIGANGSFLAETKEKNLDYIFASTSIPKNKTLYSQFGELFLGLSTLALLVILLQEKKIIKR